MNYIRILFFSILLCYSLASIAGDRERYAQSMNRMKEKLAAYPNMSANVVLNNTNVEGFLPKVDAVIHRNADQTYFKLLHLEFLFIKEYTIMVDHRLKVISYTKPDAWTKSIIHLDMFKVDSIVKLYDSVIYKGLVGGQEKYVVFNKQALIKYAEVYYNPSINFISKINYTYNAEYIGEEAKLTLEYRNINFNPIFPEQEFTLSHFLIDKDGKLFPVNTLKGYKVEKADTQFK